MADVFYVLRRNDPSGYEDHIYYGGVFRYGEMWEARSAFHGDAERFSSEDAAIDERNEIADREGITDLVVVRVETNLRVVA